MFTINFMVEGPKRLAAVVLDDDVDSVVIADLTKDLLSLELQVFLGEVQIVAISEFGNVTTVERATVRDYKRAIACVESILASDPNLCLVLFVDGSINGRWVCELLMSGSAGDGRLVTVNHSYSNPLTEPMGADFEMFGKEWLTGLNEVISFAKQRLGVS